MNTITEDAVVRPAGAAEDTSVFAACCLVIVGRQVLSHAPSQEKHKAVGEFDLLDCHAQIQLANRFLSKSAKWGHFASVIMSIFDENWLLTAVNWVDSRDLAVNMQFGTTYCGCNC